MSCVFFRKEKHGEEKSKKTNQEEKQENEVKNQYSLNYSQKRIGMMNEWGKFATTKGSGYIKIIPQPKGNFREKINIGSQAKTGVRKEALPLTQNLMDQIVSIAPNHGFNIHEINFSRQLFI